MEDNMNNIKVTAGPDFHKSRHYPFNILRVRREMYMEKMTREEVEEVRRRDRILQGVLTREEALAEWAIKNVKKGGGLGRETEVIYYFSDDRLEPVLDRIDSRLGEHQVLIFGRNKWCAVRNRAHELHKPTILGLLPPRAKIEYENEEYMGGTMP